jgi:DNA-binding response OmpR family regulator
MRVLVIEDDRSVRETIGIVLEVYHHQADLAEGGEEAYRILDRGPEHWPDAMLLDLRLRMERGEEVYAEIRRRYGRTPPTVVISASQEGATRASLLPGARFLAKPYTVDQLLGSLEQATLAGSATSKTA